MTKKKLIISIIVFFCLALMINCPSFATTRWNSLDYDCTLNSDGSMDVIETWDTYMSEVNTMFKDFKLDQSKFGGISNVKVSKVVGAGEEIDLTDIGVEQYHVNTGCYYGLTRSDNPNIFEIAWNVGFDNSSGNGVYKVYYKITDAVKIYNDCAELYWQFLSNDNEMYGDNVTGRIKMPSSVSNMDNLKVWMHGNLNGVVEKTSESLVTFSLPSISSNEMIEARVVLLENLFEDSTNVIGSNEYQNILNEETEFANAANRERMISKLVIYGVMGLIIVIYIALFISLIKKIIKYYKEGKEINSQKFDEYSIDYFRDIPNEKTSTPGRAAFLYYFNKNKTSFKSHFENIFSASILDLALKGIISFEPLEKKDLRIKLLDNEKANSAIAKLSEDERIIYKMLVKANASTADLTMNSLSKFARGEYDWFYNKKNSILEAIDNYAINYNKVDPEMKSMFDNYYNKFIMYIFVSIFMAFIPMLSLPLLVETIIACIICGFNSKKLRVLTQEGYEESQQWKGLNNYMVEYSLLEDKEVPDLILWEKYLIYATTFGVSKKVINQLKVVYPEFLNDNSYNSDFTYMYLVCNPNYGTHFMDDINSGLNKVCNDAMSAYSSAHYSSSSGDGGGFSSGGGGGGGGGSCGGR